jgi:fructose-1,6-bisphosphatase/inositol monophosphatase family enzyme
MSDSIEPYQRELAFAKQMVQAVGPLIINARNTAAFEKTFKADNSPVTDIDKQVEVIISAAISATFPGDCIIGEEISTCPATKPDRYWSIDPIDGTWSFVSYENSSAVSLSLIERGEVVVAALYNPFTNGLFYASQNGPAYMDNLTLPLRRVDAVEIVNARIPSCVADTG